MVESRNINISNKPTKNNSLANVPCFDITENKFYTKYNISESSCSGLSPGRISDKSNHFLRFKNRGTNSSSKNSEKGYSSLSRTFKNKNPTKLVARPQNTSQRRVDLSHQSSSKSIGNEVRESKKTKTLTNMKNSFESNNGTDHLGEFLQTRLLSNGKHNINGSPDALSLITTHEQNRNKFQHSALVPKTKKKKIIENSPILEERHFLNYRRGSKTPVLNNRTSKNRIPNNILANFNQAKNEMFVSSKQNKGKSRNAQMKYSTYSEQASIAKSNRDHSNPPKNMKTGIFDKKLFSITNPQMNKNELTLREIRTSGKGSYSNSFVTNTIQSNSEKYPDVQIKFEYPSGLNSSKNATKHGYSSITRGKYTTGESSDSFSNKFAFTTFQKHTKSVFPVGKKQSPRKSLKPKLTQRKSNLKPHKNFINKPRETLSKYQAPIDKKIFTGNVRNINLDISMNSSTDAMSFKAAKDSLNNLIGETKNSFRFQPFSNQLAKCKSNSKLQAKKVQPKLLSTRTTSLVKNVYLNQY